jgi:tubulin-specific chaperone B
MADVPLQVVSDNASSERRITPSWSISQLKTKLEPITGVPSSAQKLALRTATGGRISIEATDEENTFLASFPLVPYAELHVSASA